MPFTQLVEQLQRLGVREGGVLLVHASLRSLGRVEGGAETVIQALLAAVGPRGTLLLPALSYQTVTAANPNFDVRQTPSCVGALTEYFRRRAGTLRSIHPTHSVCGVGLRTGELLRGHEEDTTPCGPHSPFHKLPRYDGQILFLGCGLRPNTSMHAVEEVVQPPYLFAYPVIYDIVDATGRLSTMKVRRHNFRGWRQRYDRLANLLDGSALQTGKVLQAGCHLVEARAMWPAAVAKLRQDPFFFVEPEGAGDG
jgi:aminoglycoside 3-N-acetyltransferase